MNNDNDNNSNNASAYSVTISNNKVSQISKTPKDEELLGIEWAISEVKDAMKFNGIADGTYGLTNSLELNEFIEFLSEKIGKECIKNLPVIDS
jgi:cell division protein YceG involved in septum cleavage